MAVGPCFWVGCPGFFLFFFFNDTATTEIYTLSLHDALPICWGSTVSTCGRCGPWVCRPARLRRDRKSTRLNSSHVAISYAVFFLKKKKKQQNSEHALNGEDEGSCNDVITQR